jgi:thioredoxin 1
MPTFLIFRNGSVIKTIRGADPRGLTSAVEEAAKLAGHTSPLSTPGRTLGGTPLPGRPAQSLQRPLTWDLRNFINAVIAFFGLYFTSLFSLNAYKAAEDSIWNVNSVPPAGGPGAWVRGKKVGGGPPARNPGNPGRKIGTLSDL